MTRHSRIDTTASAIITDASTFPPESTTPNKDDQRQGIYPMRIYQGYNYLPTAYGYKSYFGTQPELDATGLEGPAGEQFVVEELFVYQTRAFVNVLIALTSHGIYLRSDEEWEHVVSLDPPGENTSLPWTSVTLSQLLFMYRQGHSHVFVLDDIVDGTGVSMDIFNGMAVQPDRTDTSTDQPVHVYEFVPTTLNMEGQIGMFRAGGSLGFWDSDDSVAWSAISDFTDFEPSLLTLANVTKFQDQIGAITAIQPHGDGFIAYCTRSVLYAVEDSSALLRYTTRVVLGNVGVAYPREIAVAEPDNTHYAFTSAGLMEITNGEAQPIIPDLSDYVKRTRLPQYMTMLNNRYLCIAVMDPNFIPGNVDFSTQSVDPEDYKYEGSEVGGINLPGYILEGRKVCFSNPSNVDEGEIVDSGVKPYHMLQLYRQWLYTGASIQFQPKSIGGGEVLYSASIQEGSTQAAYDVVPPALSADEVPGFNGTDQTDKLVERQLAVYQDRYNETVLQLQAKWDEAEEKLGISESRLRYLGESTVETSQLGESANPMSFSGHLVSGTRIASRFIIDNDGNIYGDRGPTGFSFFWNFLNNHSLEDALVRAGASHLIPILTDTSFYYTPHRYVGNIATIGAPNRYAGGGKFVRYELEDNPEFDRLGDLAYRPFDPEDPEALKLIHPEAIQFMHQRTVDSGKLAYKVSAQKSLMRVIGGGGLEEPHVILEPVAISRSFTYEASWGRLDNPRIYVTVSGELPYSWSSAEDSGSGTLRGNRADSEWDHVLIREVTLTSTLLSSEDRLSAMSSQLEADVSAAGEELVILADAYARGPLAAELEAGLNADIDSLRAQFPDRDYTVGLFTITESTADLAAVNPPRRPALGAGPGQKQTAMYRAHLFDELGGVEDVDITEELYGKVDEVVLSDTQVGVAALNALDPVVRRGLIAVHQHFYTRNNHRDVLDSSFLIPAAGREDVPLGAPLGTVPEVIEEADFANRWYEIAYAGDGGAGEHGASFAVPGQTRAESLRAEQGVVCGISSDIVVDDYVRDPIVYPPWEIEVPELTWVMQNGSRAPFNPTLHGAFVFDLHLQKWGVFKGEYKHLLDYQPVNNYTPGSIPYKNFMIDGGCLTPDMEVVLFNDYPADNLMRYGKYQHLGSEVCAIEQVHVEFAERSTGLVAVQFSLDGRSLEYGHSVAQWYNDALSTTLNCDIVGQWATISFTGHFDLAGLRVKSNPSGRR